MASVHERPPATHAQAIALTKRAVFALGAAEKAIRQLNDLLDQAGIPENAPSRRNLHALLDRATPASSDPKPVESTADWRESWKQAMDAITLKEGEKAAQSGFGETSNPYADFDDPDSKSLAAIWREGFRSVQRRRESTDAS